MERKEYTLEKMVPPVCVDCGQLAFYRFTITRESEKYYKYYCNQCSLQMMVTLKVGGFILVGAKG